MRLVGELTLLDSKSTFLERRVDLLNEAVLKARSSRTLAFKIPSDALKHPSYTGKYCAVGYALEIVVGKQCIQKQKLKVAFRVADSSKRGGSPTCLEIGVEDCLQLVIKLSSLRFPTNGVVIGQVNFELLKIPVKRMEIQLLRRETIRNSSFPSGLSL